MSCMIVPQLIFLLSFSGISTLQRWAKNFCINRGILASAISVMKIWGYEADVFQKLTVLSFDEMKIAETIEYDQDSRQFIGPYSQCTVVMARGLCSPWKQPIFIDYDVKIDESLLHSLIDALKEIQFQVVATVCDCAAVNRTLRNALGISVDNPSFCYNGDDIFFSRYSTSFKIGKKLVC